MAGRSTTDAIFIVLQLQEKYLAKKKGLWIAFVDLEKEFDRVPQEVVWWVLTVAYRRGAEGVIRLGRHSEGSGKKGEKEKKEKKRKKNIWEKHVITVQL